jgi:4-methyl-5(b-hydroxyethyl)-thiazole monophosphate biosynthesis
MKTIFLFLAQGFEETEAINVIDVLRRGNVHVTTVSVEETLSVTGSHDITVMADKLFNDIDFSKGDMLILPGGMPGTNNLNSHDDLKILIKDYYSQHKYIAAICAAPLILGQLGLLRNKEAVCFPGYEKELAGAILSDKRIVVSDNIIMAKGAGCAIEFALKLVEILQNKETSIKVANAMIVS